MTDYGYACENPNCKEPTKRNTVVKDGKRLCTKCNFEENYPGREYPY